MKNTVYSRLVSIIQHNHTWLDVKESHAYRDFVICYGGVLMTGLFHSIVFVCKTPKYGYDRGYNLTIPVYELDRAIHSMKSDSAFAYRLKTNTITDEDVEEIIKRASYGLISLDLSIIGTLIA